MGICGNWQWNRLRAYWRYYDHFFKISCFAIELELVYWNCCGQNCLFVCSSLHWSQCDHHHDVLVIVVVYQCFSCQFCCMEAVLPLHMAQLTNSNEMEGDIDAAGSKLENLYKFLQTWICRFIVFLEFSGIFHLLCRFSL